MVGVARRKRDLVAIQPVLATHALGSLDDCFTCFEVLLGKQATAMNSRFFYYPCSLLLHGTTHFLVLLLIASFFRCSSNFFKAGLGSYGVGSAPSSPPGRSYNPGFCQRN